MEGPLSDFSLSGRDRDSYSFEELHRRFSDREQLIDVFEITLHQLPPVPVLMFYGIGGTGKTYLLRYLMYQYGSRWKDTPSKYPYAFLSFQSGQTPTSTEIALWQAREQFIRTKQQIDFPRFDLLWGKLWERRYQVPISQNKELVPKELASISELLQSVERVPYIGDVAKAVNLLGWLTQHVKTSIAVKQMLGWFKDRIEVPTGLGWKAALQTMELKELVALLPAAFAADLAESADRLSPPYDRVVLFVDNYETLQEQLGEAFGKEANNFIQSLARELIALDSKTLTVIAGRDRLRWGEVRRRDGTWVLDPASLWAQEVIHRDAHLYSSRFLRQQSVGDLSEDDAREYLVERHHLIDPTTVSAIYEFTGGYPLALGVAADLIGEAGARASVDFQALRARISGYTPLSKEWREEVNDWLLERLLEQLKINRREPLITLTKAAAIPRWFTQELLYHLTGDSGISEQFRRLIGYSFVEPYEVEDVHAYRLHSVVRKIIRQTIDIPEFGDHLEDAAASWFELQADKSSGKSKWRYRFETVYHLWRRQPHQAMQRVDEWFMELESLGQAELCWDLLNTAAEFEDTLPLNIQIQLNLYRCFFYWNAWHEKGSNRELALRYAEKAVVQAENVVDERLKAAAYNAASHAFLRMGMGVSADPRYYLSRSLKMIQRECEVAEAANDPASLATGFLARACMETDLNPDYGNFSLIDKAIDLYQKAHDLHGLRNAYFDKAKLAMRLEQWELVAPSLTKAAELDQSLFSSDILSEAHRSQVWGEFYAQRRQWDAAKKALEVAKMRYEQLHFISGICAATGWLGIVQCQFGEMNEGVALIREALRMERDVLGSQEGAAKWLHYLGEVFAGRNEFERAFEAFRMSESLRESLTHSEVRKTREKIHELKELVNKDLYQRWEAEFRSRKSDFGEYAFLWGFDAFQKYDGNPILSPQGEGWESYAVFNPAAWTDGEKVYLLYRAQGSDGSAGNPLTSCIGLAISDDGVSFKREPHPVMVPTEPYEIPGGCEDPRLVYIDDTFYLTYTAYDGKTARLAMATSKDLRSWDKLGPLFPDQQWETFFPHEEHRRLFPLGWSKSGAILDKPINSYYWMYFGDTHIWVAYSKDLRKWEVIEEPVLSPRPDVFDSRLVEPGPPPLLLPEGIWLGYNAADSDLRYSFGQALFDFNDPRKLIRRSAQPLLVPSTEHEIEGQVQKVVFGEGLVRFKGKWFLYYGMADSRIGVAFEE